MPLRAPEDVTALFERFAMDLIRSGWERYSARAIMERIRWHYHVERGSREFKCNDHWTPELSRWFMRKYPQHNGFFETRAARSDFEEL